MIPISLKGKKALVGGSTQGIGKAIAVELARSGSSVILMARNEQKLKNTLSELPANDGQSHQYLVADFSQFGSFKDKISSFLKGSPIDILVNNTQGPAAGTAFDKNPADYQEAFDLLFQTVVHTSMEALPYMQKNKFGRIINVSSVTVKEPIQNLVLSNSIRSALLSWAKTLSNEVAKDNITINTILTGLFDTERLNQLIKLQAEKNNTSFDDWKEKMISNVPMKRLGQPSEYGYLAAFLASDMAAYITGASIPVDGGLLNSV